MLFASKSTVNYMLHFGIVNNILATQYFCIKSPSTVSMMPLEHTLYALGLLAANTCTSECNECDRILSEV